MIEFIKANPWVWAVAAAVAVLAIVGIVLAVRHGGKSSRTYDDRPILEKAARTVDVLISMTELAGAKAKLAALKEKIEFTVPSENCINDDKKICGLLDDFRIRLQKSPDDSDMIDAEIRGLETRLAARNVKIG